MISCDWMSDQMPAVAHGTARWSADEERHLVHCEACRLEWALVRRVKDIGFDSGVPLDETRIAEAVLSRVRTAEGTATRRRIWSLAGLAVAAGLVAVFGGQMLSAPRSVVTPAPESLAVAVPAAPSPESLSGPLETAQVGSWIPELGELSADEAEMIMESLNEPIRADELLESPAWVDGDSRGFVPGLSS